MTVWQAICWFGLSGLAVITAMFLIAETVELITSWRSRTAKLNVLREVIRADSKMFANCLRLSIEHFRALNRLRDGGWR